MSHYRTVRVEIVKAELDDNGELPLARGTGADGRVITYDLAEGLHTQLQKLGVTSEAERKHFIQKYLKSCSATLRGHLRVVYRYTMQQATGAQKIHEIEGMDHLNDTLRHIFIPEWRKLNQAPQTVPATKPQAGGNSSAAADTTPKATAKPLGPKTPSMKHASSSKGAGRSNLGTGASGAAAAAGRTAGGSRSTERKASRAAATPATAVIQHHAGASSAAAATAGPQLAAQPPPATPGAPSTPPPPPAAAAAAETVLASPTAQPTPTNPAAPSTTPAAAGVSTIPTDRATAADSVRSGLLPQDSDMMLQWAKSNPDLDPEFMKALQLVTQREIIQARCKSQEVSLRERTLEHFRDVMNFTGVAHTPLPSSSGHLALQQQLPQQCDGDAVLVDDS